MKTTSCFDENSVTKVADQIFKRKMKRDFDDYSKEIVDTTNYFMITYFNKIRADNPNMKGNGGMKVKISKKDCKMIDLVIYK